MEFLKEMLLYGCVVLAYLGIGTYVLATLDAENEIDCSRFPGVFISYLLWPVLLIWSLIILVRREIL